MPKYADRQCGSCLWSVHMHHLLYSFTTCCKILPSKGLWSQLGLLASLLQMPKGFIGRYKLKKKLKGGALSADTFEWAVLDWQHWRTNHSLHLQFGFPWSKSRELLSQHSLCCNLSSAQPQICLFEPDQWGRGTARPRPSLRNNLFVKMVSSHCPKLAVANVCISEARADIKQQCLSAEQGCSCRKFSVLCYKSWKWCSSKLCSLTEYELSSFDPLIRWPLIFLKTIYACEVYCSARW